MASERAATAGARPLRSPAPAGAGREAPERTPRPGFRVLSQQDLGRRRQRRSARILVGMSAAAVAGALGLVAAFNSLVASDQLQADNVQAQVAQAISANQALQLQRAELEAPSRILAIAEHKLGMVQPTSVIYLSPVSLHSVGTRAGSSPTGTRPGAGASLTLGHVSARSKP